MWNKCGRIIMRLSERLRIKPERALDVWYSSKTNLRLHDPNDILYLMSDLYIVDELILEIQGR